VRAHINQKWAQFIALNEVLLQSDSEPDTNILGDISPDTQKFDSHGINNLHIQRSNSFFFAQKASEFRFPALLTKCDKQASYLTLVP